MTSLRARLLAGTTIAVLIAIALIGVVVVTSTRATLQTQFDTTLASDARAIATQVEEDDGKIASEFDPRTLEPGEGFAIWDGPTLLAGRKDLRAAETDRVASASESRQISLHTFARQEPDEPHGPPHPIVIVLSRPTATVDAAITHITVVIIGVGLAGLALSLGLLVWSVHAGLRPIRDLAGSIAAVRADDLSTRVTTAKTPRELLPITSRLDELLDRVAAAFERERELTAEVAHELRTPLSGLLATIELALDRDRPAEKYRAALTQCLEITQGTQRVVESLLSLARLDAGQTAVRMTPVDLDELVREGLGKISTRAKEREIEVVTELEPVIVTTDADKLRVIVANLVDNAVTYADRGGEIRATLLGGTLRIANTGCQLEPAQVLRVFERFWRADPSREAGHVGIGLALSKKLTELIGGTLDVSVQDRRFTATVTL